MDYGIGVYLNYGDLAILYQVGKRSLRLATNPIFWKIKTLYDFNISSEEMYNEVSYFLKPISVMPDFGGFQFPGRNFMANY